MRFRLEGVISELSEDKNGIMQVKLNSNKLIMQDKNGVKKNVWVEDRDEDSAILLPVDENFVVNSQLKYIVNQLANANRYAQFYIDLSIVTLNILKGRIGLKRKCILPTAKKARFWFYEIVKVTVPAKSNY